MEDGWKPRLRTEVGMTGGPDATGKNLQMWLWHCYPRLYGQLKFMVTPATPVNNLRRLWVFVSLYSHSRSGRGYKELSPGHVTSRY
jgi:hypothetical protein